MTTQGSASSQEGLSIFFIFHRTKTLNYDIPLIFYFVRRMLLHLSYFAQFIKKGTFNHSCKYPSQKSLKIIKNQ